jgi:hypothetical protein
MLTLFTTLLDRCIQLQRERETNQKLLFQNSVEPLYQVFQAIHRDYVQTFVGYRKTVRGWREIRSNIHDFCQQLHEDNLLTANLRTKIHAANVGKPPPGTRLVLESIINYVTGQVGVIHGTEGGVECGQVYRSTLMAQIQKLTSDAKVTDEQLRERIVEMIDHVLQLLEGGAKGVEESYIQQKRNLL